MAGGSSAVHMVARTGEATWTRSRCEVAASNRSSYAGFDGATTKPSGGSQGKVAVEDRSLSVGFVGLATKPSGGGFAGLGLKTRHEDPGEIEDRPNRPDRFAKPV